MNHFVPFSLLIFSEEHGLLAQDPEFHNTSCALYLKPGFYGTTDDHRLS